MVPSSSRPHPRRSLLILSGAALSFALAQTTLVPALGELGRRFGADASELAWTVTGYLLSAAVCTPVFGRLGDIFGKRRLLVLSLLLFGAGSGVSALSDSLLGIVLGRVLQGAGGGIFPLCFGIIRDEFPAERVAGSIGLLSATLGIGGGLGLIVGGLLVDHASYHWIFWLGAAMAAAAALAAQLLIPESPHRAPARVDLRGAAILGVGLAAPLLAISRANEWGWGSARLLALVGLGLAILAGWVALERRTAEPLVDIAMLSRRPVLLTNVATLLVGWGMFASFILIPQLVEAPVSTGYGFGASATQAGLIMLPGALMMLPAGPLSGVLSARMGSKVPLALGAGVTTVGLVGLAFAHTTRLEVLAFNAVSSVGIGLAYAAMPNLIVEAVPQRQTGEATGVNALVRSVGSSLGSQISSAVLAGSAVAGSTLASDSGYQRAFLLSAVVAGAAGLLALTIPRAATGEHAPVADELAAASPLADPAYASERF